MKYFEKLELINADLDRTFPAGNNPFQMMTRLLEEAGELAEQVHIFEKSGVKADKHGEPDPHKMAKEIQDVIGCALQVARFYGIMPQVKQGIEMRFERRVADGRFAAEELRTVNEWPPRNVICAGAVVVKKGKVLLVRQAADTSLAGQWSVPWGLVDRNEFPDVAAVRETLEEAGTSAKIEGLIGVQNLKWQNGTAFAYLCSHMSGDPTTDGVETDKARYFSLAEMDDLSEPIEKWTEWLARRVLQGDYKLIPAEDENPFRPFNAFF